MYLMLEYHHILTVSIQHAFTNDKKKKRTLTVFSLHKHIMQRQSRVSVISGSARLGMLYMTAFIHLFVNPSGFSQVTEKKFPIPLLLTAVFNVLTNSAFVTIRINNIGL